MLPVPLILQESAPLRYIVWQGLIGLGFILFSGQGGVLGVTLEAGVRQKGPSRETVDSEGTGCIETGAKRTHHLDRSHERRLHRYQRG